MKVGCERCGASYSVADEKVAGRKLRLRCKKCGEAILIDKANADADTARAEMIDQGDPTPENLSAPTVDADASWYVEIDGTAQGPFAFEEVAAQLEQGRITLDTLVYGVDFTDWRAISMVPELKAHAAPPPVPAVAKAMKSASNAQDREPTVEVPLASFGYSMGSDPFEEAENKPIPALSPRVSASEMMTVGLQREGTVQFSVDQIRALSSVSSPSLAPVAPITTKPGFASGDGSGLIDIRSFGEAPPEDGYRPISGMLASPLDTIAPLTLPTAVQRPTGVDLRTKVLAGLAALACVATSVVATLALTRQPESAAPQSATALAAAPVGAATLPEATPEPAPAAPAPAKAAAAEPVAAAGQAAAAAPAEDERSAAPRRSAGAGQKTKTSSHATRNAETVSARAAAEKPATPAKEKGRSTVDIDDILAGAGKDKPEKAKAKGGDSIDDLLDSAVSGKSAPAKPAAEPEAKNAGLPAAPSREEMLSALGKAKAKTAKCKGPGVATATIKISGAGKVSSVTVAGVEGAAKTCVESAVKSTTFPKSQKDSFEVKFPFPLK